MNCTICHKPIVLIPSAQDRATLYGGKASDYTRLFTTADKPLKPPQHTLYVARR